MLVNLDRVVRERETLSIKVEFQHKKGSLERESKTFQTAFLMFVCQNLMKMIKYVCTQGCAHILFAEGEAMLLRIGEKVINKEKVYHTVEHILDMRSHGFSQQETANRLHVDRTFISRLESIGEIRKGRRVAVIGFPIGNCNELRQMACDFGLEYHLLLSEKERWGFVQTKSGIELFNKIMDIIATLRQFDIVIVLASNMRIQLMKTLLDKEVIAVQIGESPIEEDVIVDLVQMKRLFDQLQLKVGDGR